MFAVVVIVVRRENYLMGPEKDGEMRKAARAQLIYCRHQKRVSRND